MQAVGVAVSDGVGEGDVDAVTLARPHDEWLDRVVLQAGGELAAGHEAGNLVVDLL